MIKFFVGQRVRVKFADEPLAVPLVGAETRIMGEFFGIFDVYWELGLAHPSGGLWRVPKKDASDCLEPILPDGHRSGDYSLSELMDRCKQGEGVSA